MAQEEQDNMLLVEAELAQHVSSFALDIGTSLAKVVYRSKKDYKDGKPIFAQGDTNVGRLRLALMPRFDPKVLIQFIQDNVDRPEVGSTPSSVPATGCGSSIYGRQLEQALNIKIQQIPEWDGFAAGLHFLQKNDPLQSLCLETSATGQADAMERVTMLMKVMATLDQFSDVKMGNVGPASNRKDEETASSPDGSSTKAVDKEKPTETACLLAMIGSSTGWLQVGGPGLTHALDMSATAGGTFVGLGRLLTRSNKTFLELIELAKQGDPKKVDICGNDLKPDTDQGDVYSAVAYDVSVCHFGKALVNPEGDFKDADLMASLLDTICTELIRGTRLNAQVNGLENVYLAGNFVSDDHVRRIMTRDIIVSKLLSKQQNAPDIQFLRHGGYLGAIGTMMVDARKTANK